MTTEFEIHTFYVFSIHTWHNKCLSQGSTGKLLVECPIGLTMLLTNKPMHTWSRDGWKRGGENSVRSDGGEKRVKRGDCTCNKAYLEGNKTWMAAERYVHGCVHPQSQSQKIILSYIWSMDWWPQVPLQRNHQKTCISPWEEHWLYQCKVSKYTCLSKVQHSDWAHGQVMTCRSPSCKQEFCFVCLRPKVGMWRIHNTKWDSAPRIECIIWLGIGRTVHNEHDWWPCTLNVHF